MPLSSLLSDERVNGRLDWHATAGAVVVVLAEVVVLDEVVVVVLAEVVVLEEEVVVVLVGGWN